MINNSELYQNSNINVDEDWFQEFTSSANELMTNFVNGYNQTNQDETEDDQLDESVLDGFCEVDDSGNDGNCDTLLDNAAYDANQMFTFAPGEGQRPLKLYQDQMAEYLSFPTIFCGKGRMENTQRQVQVSYADIAKWELRSVDRRAAQSVPNLFWQTEENSAKTSYRQMQPGPKKMQDKGEKLYS